jgi:hypothetical protein
MLRRKSQQLEMSYGTTVTDLVAMVTGDDESAKPILKQNRAFIDGAACRRRRSHLHAPLCGG